MFAFFEYIRELFSALFRNIGRNLEYLFVKPFANLDNDIGEYASVFENYMPQFGFLGWLFFVLFIIAILAIIGSIGYLVYLLVRKIVKFHVKHVSKEKLISQVQELNAQLYKAVQEKNEILKLKVDSLNLPPGENGEDVDSAVASVFPKLAAIDAAYKDIDTSIVMEEVDSNIGLKELTQRFRGFAASQMGLYYDLATVRTFFAAMGTSKIIILEGISGTGKTSLPYAVGKFINRDVAICSVQPSWRDRTELIGYYNEFTKKFNESEFLKAVYESAYRKDNNLLILDEMNLARIEYYFAEFLSIMEMPNTNEWLIEVTKTNSKDNPNLIKTGKLLIPQNLWFIGTANNDDSTFTITDKVYDRAISMSLNTKGVRFDAHYEESLNISYEYLNKLFEEAYTNYPISEGLLAKFTKLDTFITGKFQIAFGNRIMKQLKLFVPVYVACGGSEIEALDFIFTSKVLKKFSSLNLAFLHEELKQLTTQFDKLFGKGSLKLASAQVEQYIKNS